MQHGSNKTKRRPLVAVCAGLLLIAIAGGFAFDEWPAVSPEQRADKYLLQVDLHTHTRMSDGFLSPPELVMAARRRGLDALAVTEHNTVLPAYIARRFTDLCASPQMPTVIVGQEVTSREVHLLAVGISQAVKPRRDLGLVIDAIHRQRGVAIAAHPTRRYWPALTPHRAALDGAEVVSPMAFYGDEAASRYRDVVAFYEKGRGDGQPLTAVGASDFHFFGLMGLTRTYVLASANAAEPIVDAIRRGDTAAIAPDGRIFGSATVAAELARKPPRKPPPHPYLSRHPLDAVSRALGLLALLLLLTLQWQKPTKNGHAQA